MAQIDKPNLHFNTTIWTGDNTTPKTFTTGTFKPDLLWGKIRSQAYNHQLFDTTRGAGSDKEIVPSSNGAEGASNGEVYGYVSAFTSTGFTFTKGSDSAGYDYWNESPDKYVAWTWKANGGTTSSNSDGSITSTVQANTTAGFSIVSFTGTGANGTVGHGLGAVPKMIIQKNRSISAAWSVWHGSFTGAQVIYLNETGAVGSNTSSWNSTVPTASVFSVGTGSYPNGSGNTQIYYVFAEKKGFSKFGNYTGNGSAGNPPYIYTGFKPAFVMVKNTSQADGWFMHDNKRDGYNDDNEYIFANLSNAEGSNVNRIRFFSNGFSVPTADKSHNVDGNGYIYMAFAENPLVGSNNVPAVAK